MRRSPPQHFLQRTVTDETSSLLTDRPSATLHETVHFSPPKISPPSRPPNSLIFYDIDCQSSAKAFVRSASPIAWMIPPGSTVFLSWQLSRPVCLHFHLFWHLHNLVQEWMSINASVAFAKDSNHMPSRDSLDFLSIIIESSKIQVLVFWQELSRSF